MSIKNWKADDRPREKFNQKGKQAVSDSELLAILIGMGSRQHSALDIARIMLSTHGNSLDNLAKLSIEDLTKFPGIGLAKAITISAALEIGNRRTQITDMELPIINSSATAYEILRPKLVDLQQEVFYVLFLSRKLQPIKMEKISMGSTHATVVDIKVIAKQAIGHMAASVIVAHNHPSGSLEPSEEDLKVTIKIKEALKLIDVQLQDHLIITNRGYYSFADESKL